MKDVKRRKTWPGVAPPSMLRVATVMVLLACSITALFAENNGSAVNYNGGYESLQDAALWVIGLMSYTVEVVYAIAGIFIIYNATAIYIKLQTGEGGVVKSSLMLVGACLFLATAMTVLPAFFGYDYMQRGKTVFNPLW